MDQVSDISKYISENWISIYNDKNIDPTLLNNKELIIHIIKNINPKFYIALPTYLQANEEILMTYLSKRVLYSAIDDLPKSIRYTENLILKILKLKFNKLLIEKLLINYDINKRKDLLLKIIKISNDIKYYEFLFQEPEYPILLYYYLKDNSHAILIHEFNFSNRKEKINMKYFDYNFLSNLFFNYINEATINVCFNSDYDCNFLYN